MNKPFSFGIPVSGDLFTDREEETRRLVANFSNGINTFILSPRRWGKTSLVKKAISLSQGKSLKFVYMDILHCRTREDFLKVFARSVLEQTGGKMELSPDSMAPFSLKLDWRDSDIPVNEILSLPERIAQKKKINIVVCIDEFQQITEFNDPVSFQALLRGTWQLHEKVSYCLFGSKKHSMQGLFDTQEKPFYKFGDILNLKTIPLEYWIPFISGKFREAGKDISAEMCMQICTTVKFNSSYIQQLSWYVFQSSGNRVGEEDLRSATDELILQCSDVFEARTQDLTNYQMRFLEAIADGVNTGFTTSHVVSKYKLGSSANAVALKKNLYEKGLIEIEGATVTFADPVMALWLKTMYRQ